MLNAIYGCYTEDIYFMIYKQLCIQTIKKVLFNALLPNSQDSLRRYVYYHQHINQLASSNIIKVLIMVCLRIFPDKKIDG
jgi:hypothetical protein